MCRARGCIRRSIGWLSGSSVSAGSKLLHSPIIGPRLINLWVTPPIAPNNALMQRALEAIYTVVDPFNHRYIIRSVRG